jgi:hypothetical protein
MTAPISWTAPSHGGEELFEGAILVVVVLLCAAGQLARGAHRRARHPALLLFAMTGMVRAGQRQPDEPRRD